jgi:hypothetical protein
MASLAILLCTLLVERVSKFDLNRKTVRRVNVQQLSIAQKQRRVLRCRAFLQNRRHQLREIMFCNEKVFHCSPRLNRRNGVLYMCRDDAKLSLPPERATRAAHTYSPSVMVWCGISYAGKATLIIIPPRMTIDSQVRHFNFIL